MSGLDGGEIGSVVGNLQQIPENLWKTIVYIADMYVSANSNRCVLSDRLREKALYLTVAVFLLKTINNFILRKNSSPITSAKEGEVSIGYQDVPAKTVRDWFLTDPAVQPFGFALYQILQLVQPCLAIDLKYPVPYYNIVGGWYDF